LSHDTGKTSSLEARGGTEREEPRGCFLVYGNLARGITMELNLGEEQGTGNARSDEGGVRHSNQFLETYYQQLQDRPARKTWEDFKKDKQSSLEKSAGGSDMAR